jgi:hypothetical protein
MSNLNPQTPINTLSIPGTHDSSAFQSTSMLFNLLYGPWKTQNLSLE